MRTDVLGVGFDNYSMARAVDYAVSLTEKDGGHFVVTPNAEILVNIRKDKAAREVFEHADLVLPDGIGVIKAAKLLRRPLTERVAGIDFAQNLMMEPSCSGKRIYLLGGAAGVAEEARAKLAHRFPGIDFCGCHHGYFKTSEETAAVVADIKEKNPDILFVCLGAPKQEKWMYTHLDAFGNCLMAGLGGCLDVWSGRIERAPQWYIAHGCEWLYRLIKQPSRVGRALKLPYFIGLVILQRTGILKP
ncbi:N-acetylmannosaminyltransferase [Clostridia bacterium]|nr:N-acetylmannosaminyltransferase [Clostridia bacterium]